MTVRVLPKAAMALFLAASAATSVALVWRSKSCLSAHLFHAGGSRFRRFLGFGGLIPNNSECDSADDGQCDGRENRQVIPNVFSWQAVNDDVVLLQEQE
jgi:hypothetical protein